MNKFTELDLRELAEAKRLLEETTLAQRAIELIGRPVEWGMRRLPEAARAAVAKASEKALTKAADVACRTLAGERACRPAQLGLHKAAVICTGAAGGFFGLPGLAVELPLSVTIMLRSIAQIGRHHGENLNDPESRLACLQVFALGGRTPDDDAMDSAYLATRIFLGQETRAAAAWLLGGASSARDAAPFMIALVNRIAARFSVQVEEKLIAEAMPVIGALGGAAVNGLFIDFFQDKARGHFLYRRLERAHGPDAVAEAYGRL